MAAEAFAFSHDTSPRQGRPTEPEPAVGGAVESGHETIIEKILCELTVGDYREVTELFEDANLMVPEIRISPTSGQMNDEVFGFMIDHWRALRGRRQVPLACDLDPLDLRPALGYLTLLDVLDQGRDFRYRLYGSEVVTHTGYDLTGKLFSEINEVDSVGQVVPIFFMAVCRHIVANGEPIFTIHQPRETTTKYHWHRLALPLANQRGEIIRILNCVRPSDIETSRYDQPLRGSPM